jgi:hypothetical protein
MHQAHFPASRAKGALNGPMVFAGPLDDHDEITQIVLSLSLADAINGGRKVAARMSNGGWFEKVLAVEIRQ